MSRVSKCIIKEMARRAWGWVRTFITGFTFMAAVVGVMSGILYLLIELDKFYPWVITTLFFFFLGIIFFVFAHAIVRKIVETYKEVKEQCERCE